MDQNRNLQRPGQRTSCARAEEADQARGSALRPTSAGDELPEQTAGSEHPPPKRLAGPPKRRLAERKGPSPSMKDDSKPEVQKLEIDLEATVLSRPVCAAAVGSSGWRVRAPGSSKLAEPEAGRARFPAIAMTGSSRRWNALRRTTRSTSTLSRPMERWACHSPRHPRAG